jgi:predicted NUDIX family phosphoesterase
MGKMDEMILAVDREVLFESELLTFQGVLTEPEHVRRITKKFDSYKEVRRGDAEEDLTLKQPIPYAVVKRGDEVFVYKRLKAGGEARLHDSLSIGVGGHMNRVNDIRNWDSNLMINFFRELSEELNITGLESDEIEPKIVGLINDDNDDTGLYHIGILMVLELPEHAEVEVEETDVIEGYWLRTRDLNKAGLFEGLESWSQLAVEVL